ncbi:MAG: TRAP transporter small permease subunit [Tabrizicola sp.]|nr:TRAP transporter small permease subunit [Tabrizicola sp.]
MFTSALPARPNRLLVAIWEALFAVVMAAILWRLFVGILGKFGNGETTLFLQFPVWWAYAAYLVPAAAAALVALWSAHDRWRAALTGHETRPIQQEKSH